MPLILLQICWDQMPPNCAISFHSPKPYCSKLHTYHIFNSKSKHQPRTWFLSNDDMNIFLFVLFLWSIIDRNILMLHVMNSNLPRWKYLNPFPVKMFSRNIKIYRRLFTNFDFEISQVIEIFPPGKWSAIYPMFLRWKETKTSTLMVLT